MVSLSPKLSQSPGKLVFLVLLFFFGIVFWFCGNWFFGFCGNWFFGLVGIGFSKSPAKLLLLGCFGFLVLVALAGTVFFNGNSLKCFVL